MNSEELEVSLRTEFESYLKNTLAEMQQEVAQLQEQVSTELDRHKAQLDDFFASAVSNFAKEHNFEESFKETVVEHLRLARDEGAQITAMAIARAEEMEEKTVSSVGVKEIYEAVNDISTKPSQSEILKSLVQHATHFAPRGAFFIVKNEHLIGWRVFGKEKGAAEEKVREVFLPISSDSILGEAVKNLGTVANDNGGFSADAEIFQKLEFGAPEKMVAIPLVARGRGVAVLYADQGSENGNVNVEALETLVRVSGLTVEVLASSKSAATTKKVAEKKADEVSAVKENAFSETGGLSSEVLANYQSYATPAVTSTVSTVVEPAYQSFAAPLETAQETVEITGFVAPSKADEYYSETEIAESPIDNFSAGSVVESDYQATAPAVEFESFNKTSEPEVESVASSNAFETSSWSPQVAEKIEEKVEENATNDYVSDYSYQTEAEEKYPAFETSSWSSTATEATQPTQAFSAQEFAQNFAKETDPVEYAKDFSYQAEEVQPVQYEESQPVQEETPVEEFVPTKEQTFEVDTTSTVATPKSRLSERNVDLPIEVGEDERRLHNDARRFARLLVSEIKLYNEQKVKEGRDSSDLYDRLKEAIDRSREMYDKRVQPPVAAKFDYFHYELVNTLAEGDDNKLGSDYPGSAV